MDLLEYLSQHNEKLQSLANVAFSVTINNVLKHCTMALEALYNVTKNNTGVEIQCIGYFKLLFGFLSVLSQDIQKNTLNVLSLITRNQECVNDIASSEVIAHLLLALYSIPEEQVHSLQILYALMSTNKIVKEALNKGNLYSKNSFISNDLNSLTLP